ncbi:tRNA (adenosine(37)-N6)-dimethylallyltransferase MiaA [Vagococcus fessus]|nr:tRNA (adenosine(37)-N6)-dimethylallyltransferase MiaA [Vagococcus fessus]
MKEKVLVIVGPTAVGKTALGVSLAKKYNGEVISGDSLQVYRGLDVGTAKATEEEMDGIPHHLIDVCELGDTFSASDFQEQGRALIQDITSRGKLPIIVGGTGLYVQALLFDFQLGGEEKVQENSVLRDELQAYADTEGPDKLWKRLESQDKRAAGQIHPNNVKRVIRAIEVIETTGKSITEQKQVDYKDLSNALYDVKFIALGTDRERLYERINRRVDLMVPKGIETEAKMIFDFGECQAAQGIGYKEFFPYFEGRATKEETIELVKQQSRRYAKRQMTWFRNRTSAQWWDILSEPDAVEQLEKSVAEWL